MNKLWIEDEPKGPCTLEDLRVMWEEGDIDGETLYAWEGSDEYKPLSELADILNIGIPAPPSGEPAPAVEESAAIPDELAVVSDEPVPVPEQTPPAADEPVAIQNPAEPETKSYRTPIPVLIIYAVGVAAVAFGIFLLFSGNPGSNVLDREFYVSLVSTGVGALLMGYLYDLIAQCLFQLKEANRLLRGKAAD